MRQVILASAILIGSTASALAQDVNWSGFYVGAHVGGVWGNTTTTDNIKDGVPPGPFSYSTGGAFGGGTAGYNHQFGQAVVGIEADLGYMGLDGSGMIGSAHVGNHQDLTTNGGTYGDVTGRLGWSFNKFLVYGKGGFAFYDGGVSQTTTAPGYVTHGTGTFTGWTAGAGVEYAWTDKISLKIEYQHFDFGTQGADQTSVSDPPIGHVYTNTNALDADSVKVGVNYHF